MLQQIWQVVTGGSLIGLIYSFICTVLFCMILQVSFLRKKKLGMKHFVLIYIFLIYLMYVYRVTGAGTIWDIQRLGFSIRWDEVHLIPFAQLETPVSAILNIIMTIPLGFLLPFIWKQFRSLQRVALTGFAFSLLIEISQLFTRRGSATEDLITNTFGAIIGYLIFTVIFKSLRNDVTLSSQKEENFLLRNEAKLYIVCSFLGMFLFYHPLAMYENFSWFQGNISGELQEADFILGNVSEIHENYIIINKSDVHILPDGSMIGASDVLENNPFNIYVTELTDFYVHDVVMSDPNNYTATSVTIDDLRIGDSINAYIVAEDDEAVADKIIIWRFHD